MRINSLRITPEILNIIAAIDEFKDTWKVLGNLAPEQLTSLRRVATIESIGSSTRIEGSKLSDQQVQVLLSNLQIQKFENRDEGTSVVGTVTSIVRKYLRTGKVTWTGSYQ